MVGYQVPACSACPCDETKHRHDAVLIQVPLAQHPICLVKFFDHLPQPILDWQVFAVHTLHWSGIHGARKAKGHLQHVGGLPLPPLKDNIILMNPVSTASRFKRTLTLTAHVTMKFHVQKNTHWQDMPLQNFSQVLQTKLEPFEPSCTNWNKPSLVQGSEKGFELLLSLRGCRVQITGQQHSEQNALDLREALHNVDAQGFDFHFLSSEPRHLEQILNQQAWVNLLACDGLKQHSVLGSLGPCRKMSFDLKSSFKAALRLELIHPQVHEPSRRQRTPSVPRLSASLQGSATHRSEGSALTASWQVSTWFRS